MGQSFDYRPPYLTIGFSCILIVLYWLEPHPDTTISIGQYVLSAFSCYTLPQLASELSLLWLGMAPAEQFTKRWVLLVFTLLVGPGTIWLGEVTHPQTLVEGLSGASLGLVAFSVLAIIWYLIDRPESNYVFIVLSTIVIGGLIEVMTGVYGYFTQTQIFATSFIIHIYRSNIMYISHFAGIVIGGGWWIIGNVIDDVK